MPRWDTEGSIGTIKWHANLKSLKEMMEVQTHQSDVQFIPVMVHGVKYSIMQQVMW
jgi:hypothetical protein